MAITSEKYSDNLWFATLWIEREKYTGLGETQDIAKNNLLAHLKGLKPICLEQIRQACAILTAIEEITNG